MIYPINHIRDAIKVGVQTDNDVEVIGFDLKPWVDALPGMSWTVMATRPGENEAYPVKEQMMVGTVLYWHPDGYDTELAGDGKVEIVGVGENQRKLSGPMLTTVNATSVGATKEPGESAAPWYEAVLKAAEDAKGSVDAGEGTLYLIRQSGSKTDRTYDEINAAINAKKTCILTDTMGRVHLYSNRSSDQDLIFRAFQYGTPIGSGAYTSLTMYEAHIDKDGKISNIAISPINAPNPHKLTIEQNGKTVAYDGTKAVDIKVEGGVPDPGKAHQQLVSDADGKAVWEERLAYKHVQSGTMTLFAEEALMENPEDPNVYFSATPLTAIPEVGKTYEVTINGTKYSTTAHPVEEDGAQIAVLLGNPVFGGLEATEELYGIVIPLPEHQAVMGGMSIIFLSDLDADSITLSIKGQATIKTVKKIDPEYLPDTHKTITLMVDADRNVMTDTPFSEAIVMDNAQLQASIKVVQTGSYGGQPSTEESDVQVRRRSVEGIGDMLEITFRQFADPGDYPAAKEVTRYIYWSSQGLQFPAFKLYSLPVMAAGWGYDLQTYYLRCVDGVWQPATIDQLKADLGLT